MNGDMKMKLLPGRMSKLFRFGIYAVVLLGVAGCSSMSSFSPTSAALQLDITSKLTPGQIVHPKSPVVLRVAEYADARSAAPSRKIGDINATVFDMLGAELLMENVANTVTAAMRNQISASGFQTDTEDGKAAAGSADFEVSGVIREFSMNIGGRDEVSIVVETTLRDVRSGSVLWSGSVAEKADRYAGVNGNTRRSIARYLSGALARVSADTRDAISASVMQVYPEKFAQAVPASAVAPGANVLVAPSERRTISAPARSTMTGQLAVTTIPSRAKVYVAGVYYGLSPLKLELEPGIYTTDIKLDTFKTATEKVSLRKGETTELEITLEK